MSSAFSNKGSNLAQIPNISNSALVLFSGGQDSATCLAWALTQYDYVETVGIDYNQRHQVELSCRQQFIQKLREKWPNWSARLGNDHLLNLQVLQEISQTALTQTSEITLSENGLPNTFVPGRNILFFTLAAALAYRRGLRVLVGGMCETDFSGYPDCRDDTIKALQATLNLGMASRLIIQTPLMWLDKAQTWQLAEDIAGSELVNIIRTETHTCYLGNRDSIHDWGYGCGHCPACELRQRGYDKYIDSKK